jgi:hypothetical protein
MTLSTSGWGRDREMCPMIFGLKILRLEIEDSRIPKKQY